MTELHARLDVKARTKAKAAELRGRATTPDGKPDPRVVAAAVAVVVLAGVAFWRKHH